MDLGSLFLILALLLVVGLFVARPLLERKLDPAIAEYSQQDQILSGLLAERDQVINALQELEFDQTLGKIPEDEYPAQRAALISTGINILMRIDELQPSSSSSDAESRLESAITARRADAAVQVPSGYRDLKSTPPDDDLELLIASRKRSRTEKAAGFCPQCGGPLQKTDKFCPKCGYRLI